MHSWALERIVPNGDSAYEGLSLYLPDPRTQSFWCLLFISLEDWQMTILERLKIKPKIHLVILYWTNGYAYSTTTVYQHEQQVSVEYLARWEQFWSDQILIILSDHKGPTMRAAWSTGLKQSCPSVDTALGSPCYTSWCLVFPSNTADSSLPSVTLSFLV